MASPAFDHTPPPVGISSEVPYDLARALAQCEQFGLDDGRRGAPDQGSLDKVAATGDQALTFTHSRVEQAIAEAKQNVTLETKLMQEADSAFTQVQSRLNAAEADRETRPGSYNRPLGWILIVASALLLISDVPLSLSLVGKGLQIPSQARQASADTVAGDPFIRQDVTVRTPEEDAAWRQAAKDGKVLTPTDLVRRPGASAMLFWDTYALGLGIALLGFALKPLLDMIIGEGDARTRWASWTLVSIGGILFITTTLSLGVFRGKTLNQEVLASVDAQDRSLAAAEVRANVDGNQDLARTLKTQRDALASTRRDVSQQSRLPTTTFILLTTALPFIGAMCFFFGTHRLERAQMLTRLERERNNAAQRLRAASERLATAQARLHQLTTFLAHLTQQAFHGNYLGLLASSYRRSFTHGVNDSERDLGALTLFARLRHACYGAVAVHQRARGPKPS